MSKSKPRTAEAAQIGRFGLVGILNTVIDIVIFNLLTGLHIISNAAVASIFSGTVAMINSFIFNQRYTFRAKHTPPLQIGYFFALTIFGLYVIRPIVISFFTKTWLWPAHTVYRLTHALHLPLSAAFDQRNFALGMAILIVLFYNYVTYKRLVFNGHDKFAR